ncbi:T9SS type A sorting domain-containing protein [Hymenobacter busanensis]|uniref:T9SS type A sorting domain-containing protein n=1 Tax=Hymenobacter busanensis TaxID=2607656 RepID=A0A7L4ZX40_9BACT|nr:fibronectin type III domain-containing protein [Hymenobacter busanensis]KAA9325508.1 T9SS type A sorting domain-containing protein [Hymenobacter busanensis]QHJ07821.1 T9SS type A sorting domain-containing protein [Hymenobacter busanensis]
MHKALLTGQPTPWLTFFRTLWPFRLRTALGRPAGWLAVVAWLLAAHGGTAQTVTVPAGNTGTSSSRFPLAGYFGYERTAMIYLNSEVSTVPVNVQSVAWYFTTKGTGTLGTTPVKVYIKETSTSSFAVATTVATEETGATLVYDGTLPAATFTNNTWITLPLPAPFYYTGSQNLEIIVETNATGGGNGESSGTKQLRYSTATNRAQIWATDTSPPTSTGSITSNRPNLQVVLGPPPSCLPPSGLTASNLTTTTADLSWTATGGGTFTLQYGPTGFNPVTGGTTVPNIAAGSYQLTGLTPNTAYQFYVTQNCGASNSTRTGPSSFTTPAPAPDYVISRNTGVSYTSIQSTGTSFTGWSSTSSTDDNVSGSTAIGFGFQYLGQTVTNFRVSTNGWLSFNTAQVPSGTDNYANTLGNGSANTMLAPFWEDLVLQGNAGTAAALAAAKLKYQLNGTAPNRVLTVEWAEMETFNNPGPNLNFQVKLYEGVNAIEYVYGNMSGFDGSNNYTYSYSLGLSGPSASNGQYLAQQVPNAAYFLNSNATTANTGANALAIVPSCNSSIRFVPGTFTAGTPPTVAAPTNDEPAGATALTVGTVPPTDFCAVYSSAGATASGSITTCSAATPGTPDDDVWYSFTLPTVSNVTVTLRSSGGYDGVLQLFSGTPGSLTAVSCVNATANGLTENYANAALAAGTYYVRVYHAGTGSGTSGSFVLAAYATPAPPANDECATATALTPNGTTCTPLSGTTIGATASSGAPTCTATTPGTPDDDVWYGFTATANAGTLTVQSGSGFDAVVQLYSGTCGTLSSLGCINGTSTGGAEVGNLTGLVVGQPYYVRVYHAGAGTGSGSFSICLVLPTCTDPTAVSVTGITSTSANLNFTAGNGAVDYAVTLTPQGGTAATITPAPTASPVALTSLTPSTQYTVTLRQNCAGGQQSGLITRTFTTAPANDDCAGATPITSIGVGTCGTALTGTNVSATSSTGVTAPGCASYAGGDVWYTVQVPANGIIQLETGSVSGSSVSDTGMEVYSGSCGSLTAIECDDDDSPTGAYSLIRLTGRTSGETLYVRVWEYSNDTFGSFSICAQTDAACSAPTNLTAGNLTSTSASISFTAGSGNTSYTVRYTALGDSISTTVTPAPTASPVALTGLTPNTQYTVTVVGNCSGGLTSTAATVTFTTLVPPPANDECAGATAISSIGVGTCGTPVNGTTIGATASAGAPTPTCANYTTGDVWYTVQVPANGVVQVETRSVTSSALVDTGMEMYSGSCGSLTAIECDDDDSPDGQFSLVRLSGRTPGETLYVRVWTYGTKDRGAFTVCAQTDPACTPPTVVAANSLTSTSASISFTASASATSYTVTYTPQGGSATTITPAPTASPVALTGLTPSTQYTVTVTSNCAGGLTAAASSITFTTRAPAPANDECASATPITSIGVGSCGTAVSGTNVGATASSTTGTPAPGCASYSGGDVWYSLTVPANGVVQVQTDQGSGTSLSDTGLALYSGSCGNLTLIGCDDDAGTGAFSLLRATGLTPGSTVYARVWEYGNDESGSFSICAQTDAPNLVVSSSQNLPGGTYNNVTITGTGALYLQGDLVVNGALVVQTGGSLSTNNSGTCATITGPGSFTLQSGAIFGICSPAGVSASGATGSVQVAGTRSFSSGALYVYNGAAAQVTGSGLPVQVRSLTVGNAGAGVTLSQALAVKEDLALLNGNLTTNGNGLTLLSDAAGTAVVNNTGGVVNGTAAVQRYISPALNAGAGYRHYSPPVSNTTVADLATSGFTPVVNDAYNSSATPNLVTPFPTVFGYDESRVLTSPATTYSAFDKGWFSPTALSDALQVGRGYTVNIPASQTVDFVGSLNNGLVSRPLARTGGANGGLHLVGNPYPSPLDWSQVLIPAGLDNAMYVYQSNSQYGGTYRSYINGFGDPLVATAQAFFVRVSPGSTSTTLALTNAARVTSFSATQPTFNRGPETRPVVQLALRGAGGTDDATIYFEAGATAGMDGRYDALKLQYNGGGVPSVFALAAGTQLSINGLPLLTTTTVVPLGVVVPQAGLFTFEANRLLNLPGAGVYLHDDVTGLDVDLRQQPTYTFSATAAAVLTTRFSLRFEPTRPTANQTGLDAASVSVYPNPAHQSFTLLMPAVTGAKHLQATLYNSIGQQVLQQSATLSAAGAQVQINVSHLATGVYTLRILAGDAVVAKRVTID